MIEEQGVHRVYKLRITSCLNRLSPMLAPYTRQSGKCLVSVITCGSSETTGLHTPLFSFSQKSRCQPRKSKSLSPDKPKKVPEIGVLKQQRVRRIPDGRKNVCPKNNSDSAQTSGSTDFNQNCIILKFRSIQPNKKVNR